MKYSIIVPVYNRPDEVGELLESLSNQTLRDFEVIIVEDGSVKTCKDVCDKYADILVLHYYAKENSGPGQSRNYGAERANGEYIIILDSDVVLPKGYVEAIDKSLSSEKEDIVAFGGPDAAHPSFTPVQKAISYSMTSFFTTGGIRGGKAKLDKFYPRSFNMGIRRDVYLALGGFSKMRFGEDIDFSYRIVEAGYKPQLFPDAWVWHKRRTDFKKFFRQVYNSGIARINLMKRHPETRPPAAHRLHTGRHRLHHALRPRRSLVYRRRVARCLQPPSHRRHAPRRRLRVLHPRPAAPALLFTRHLHRLHHPQPQPLGRSALHPGGLRPTDGLRPRLHRIVVETMYTEKRRIPGVREKLL